MSIQTAIKQIADALAEAIAKADESRKNVVYWDAQVTKLTATHATITEQFPDVAASPSISKKGAKSDGKEKLIPKTPSEFWMGLLTTEPQKMAQILDTAAAKLGVDTSNEEVMKVLRSRQSNALAKFVEEKKIKDHGSRQDRTYFLEA